MSDASLGGLSSTGFTLLALFYLQQKRIVPNLQSSEPFELKGEALNRAVEKQAEITVCVQGVGGDARRSGSLGRGGKRKGVERFGSVQPPYQRLNQVMIDTLRGYGSDVYSGASDLLEGFFEFYAIEADLSKVIGLESLTRRYRP